MQRSAGTLRGGGGVASALLCVVACTPGQPINKDGDDIAILGYDAVAYFTEGQAVEGSAEFEHPWQGARWRFSSETHRDLFAGEPTRYAPQYGGNCAGAMARGRVARVDPEAWAIVDGKLYLNYDTRYRDEFVEDATDQIARADAEWEARGRAQE